MNQELRKPELRAFIVLVAPRHGVGKREVEILTKK